MRYDKHGTISYGSNDIQHQEHRSHHEEQITFKLYTDQRTIVWYCVYLVGRQTVDFAKALSPVHHHGAKWY
jgi:hypothetical protein